MRGPDSHLLLFWMEQTFSGTLSVPWYFLHFLTFRDTTRDCYLLLRMRRHLQRQRGKISERTTAFFDILDFITYRHHIRICLNLYFYSQSAEAENLAYRHTIPSLDDGFLSVMGMLIVSTHAIGVVSWATLVWGDGRVA